MWNFVVSISAVVFVSSFLRQLFEYADLVDFYHKVGVTTVSHPCRQLCGAFCEALVEVVAVVVLLPVLLIASFIGGILRCTTIADTIENGLNAIDYTLGKITDTCNFGFTELNESNESAIAAANKVIEFYQSSGLAVYALFQFLITVGTLELVDYIFLDYIGVVGCVALYLIVSIAYLKVFPKFYIYLVNKDAERVADAFNESCQA